MKINLSFWVILFFVTEVISLFKGKSALKGAQVSMLTTAENSCQGLQLQGMLGQEVVKTLPWMSLDKFLEDLKGGICYIIVNGFVIDVTGWISAHPVISKIYTIYCISK